MNQPHSASLWSRLWTLGETAIRGLEALQPAAQLAARWFIAGVFFRSGLTKIADWETTVALFTDEYHVPLLSPELAAAPRPPLRVREHLLPVGDRRPLLRPDGGLLLLSGGDAPPAARESRTAAAPTR